jgi:hypothetical protein
MGATWGAACAPQAPTHSPGVTVRRTVTPVREAGDDQGIAAPHLTRDDRRLSTVHRPYYDYPYRSL